MSENRDKGSRQTAGTQTNIQSMVYQVDSDPQPRAQQGHPALRDEKLVVDTILKIKQIILKHVLQMATQIQQLSVEEKTGSQDSKPQKDRLDRLTNWMIGFAWSETQHTLGLKESPLPSNIRRRIKAEMWTLTAQQHDQPDPQRGDLEAASISHILSKQGTDITNLYRTSFQEYTAYQKDKYHKVMNPGGFLNLGTSENKLCLDLILARLSRQDMKCTKEDLLHYTEWRGHPSLREEMAGFLTYYCKAPTPLDPENVVILNGCCSVFSALSMTLCDPGDAFLVPTPCYGDFSFSLKLYANINLIPVDLQSEITEGNTHPFQLTVDKFELALSQARHEAKNVKGLVLINPQNPLGDIYSRESLQEYLAFAKRHDLHVVIDEIYMLSVFHESVKFTSVLSMKNLPDPDRTHVIWGTSKDFGISGFHFGVLYTHSKDVAFAVSSFGYLHGICGISQYKLYRLLQDREWIEQVYLPLNSIRLREAYQHVTKKLERLGIPFLNRGSGLYIWINLKAFLYPCTFQEELGLHHRFLKYKLMLTSGKSYLCKEAGWFRLVFADTSDRLTLAMLRFEQALKEQKRARVQKQLEEAMRM